MRQNAKLYQKAQDEIAQRKHTEKLQEAVYQIAQAHEYVTCLDELYQARRSGKNALIIISGRAVGVREIQASARYFGIPVIPISNEDELERWGRGWVVEV